MKSAVAEKNRKLQLNGVWWFCQVAAWIALYLASPFSRDPSAPAHWFWFYFGLLFVIFLVIQAFFHWRLLTRYFPRQRRSNINWTIGMPFFVFFGFTLVRVVMAVFVASQL